METGWTEAMVTRWLFPGTCRITPGGARSVSVGLGRRGIVFAHTMSSGGRESHLAENTEQVDTWEAEHGLV
jgi:hypothetical protein